MVELDLLDSFAVSALCSALPSGSLATRKSQLVSMSYETGDPVLDFLRRSELALPDEDDAIEDSTYLDFNTNDAQELRTVVQELSTVRETLNRLRRSDFEFEDFYDQERRRLLDLSSLLQREVRSLENRLSDGFHPRERVPFPRPDMSARQRAAEAVADPNLIAISRAHNEATTLGAAWDQHDYEKVVELATQCIERLADAPARNDYEGVQRLSLNLRWRFRAYQAMKLFSLAMADANRVFELLSNSDTKMEASVQSSFESSAQGDTTDQRDATHQSDGERPKRLLSDDSSEVARKRRKENDSSVVPTRASAMFGLSAELVLVIADFLEPLDRIHLANSCRELRRLPQLWQQLVFWRVKQTLRVGWHRDTVEACVTAIETCQRRSHGALTSVMLKGFILPDDLHSILDALRPSSRTLKYLAIPTLDQSRCYYDLYRMCSALSGIDVRINHRHSTDSALFGLVERQHLGRVTSLFPSSEMPFKLKYFFASPEIDCGDISPHMNHLEIVEGVYRKRQKPASFIKGIVSAAGTLQEWNDCVEARWDSLRVQVDEYTKDQLPAGPVVFPRLRKLSALWCDHYIEYEFPALEELSFSAQRVHEHTTSVVRVPTTPAVGVISRSPMLKRLDILLPHAKECQREIFAAVAQLEKIEEVHFWTSGCSFILGWFIEHLHGDSDDVDSHRSLWPALHTFRVLVKGFPLWSHKEMERELCEILLLRFFLQKGCLGIDARKRTEAALVAYDKVSYKLNKTQKRKLMSEAKALASKSSYPGTFQTKDNLWRETFPSVLPNLLTNSDTCGC